MSEFTVHGMAGSPYVRSVLAALEEKGADYRFARMELGEHKSEAHRARNPFGKVPLLSHDGFDLYETQAILRYVDAVAGGPSLSPSDPKARARMDQLMNIADCYVFTHITIPISAERLLSQLFWQRDTDVAKVEAATPKARETLQAIAALKGDAPFVTGETVSLADLMLACHLSFLALTPEAELLKEAGLDGWLARMLNRPSLMNTQRDRLMAAA